MRFAYSLSIVLLISINIRSQAQDGGVSSPPPDLFNDPFLAPDPGPAGGSDGSVTVKVVNLTGGVSGNSVSASASYRVETNDEPAMVSYFLRVREYWRGEPGTILTSGYIPHSNSGLCSVGKQTTVTWSSSIQNALADPEASYLFEAGVHGSTAALFNGSDTDFASTYGDPQT